jgi:hypothetical protein
MSTTKTLTQSDGQSFVGGCISNESMVTDHAHCLRCGAAGPAAPASARYRDPHWMEHDWICGGCGNEWTTSKQV